MPEPKYTRQQLETMLADLDKDQDQAQDQDTLIVEDPDGKKYYLSGAPARKLYEALLADLSVPESRPGKPGSDAKRDDDDKGDREDKDDDGGDRRDSVWGRGAK
jgi:hypothetical protein